MTKHTEDAGSGAERQDDPRVVILLFALLSVLPFLLAIDGPFLFDDQLLIVNNKSLHSLDHLGALFSRGFWDTGEVDTQSVGQYFRPLVMLSFALDFQIGGGAPWSFHLTNVILQALSAGLLMATLQRWLEGNKQALLAGIIFALHPTKAESVVWISGRTDLLMMLGFALCLYGLVCSLGWEISKLPRIKRPLWGAALQCVGILLAFGSKEQAVVLPALVFAQFFLFRRRRGERFLRSDWVCLGLYGCASFVYLAVRSRLVPFSVPPEDFDLIDRAYLVFDSLGRYLELLVFPRDLSFYAAYQPLSLLGSEWPNPWYLLLGALHLVLAVSAFGIGMLGRSESGRIVAVFVALYVVCLLPVLNLIPLGTDVSVSPRYLYLPLLPLGVLAASRYRTNSPFATALLPAFMLLGLWTCFSRTWDFGAKSRFWAYELGHNPTVPPVVLAQVAADLEGGRSKLAIARASCASQLALRQGNLPELSRIWDTLADGLVRATPLLDERALKELRAFLDRVLEGQPAHLEWYGLEVQFMGSSGELAAARLSRKGLLLSRAELAIRLSEPDALHLAQQAIELCPRCSDIAIRSSRVAVQLFALDRARLWLERASVGGTPLIDGRNVATLSAEAAAHQSRAKSGEQGVLLALLLLLGNDANAVRLGGSHSELRSQVPPQLRLQLAAAAHRVGAPELAHLWLKGLLSDEELKPIHDEFSLRSVAVEPDGSIPSFSGTGCATSEEVK